MKVREEVCRILSEEPYIVEVKRRNRIEESVAVELDAKIRRLGLPSSVLVRTALVYDGEIASSLRTDRKFDFLVPVERFFNQ